MPSPRAHDVHVFGAQEEQAYRQHFREHGFVVVGEVLEASQVGLRGPFWVPGRWRPAWMRSGAVKAC